MSDHTNSIFSSIASMPIGVVAIEKHYKLSNKDNTTDSKFSIVPKDLLQMKKVLSKLNSSLHIKKKNNNENTSMKLRRSIYSIEDIQIGERFTKKNLGTFRPQLGVPASKYFDLIGKKSKKKIKAYTPIKKKYF